MYTDGSIKCLGRCIEPTGLRVGSSLADGLTDQFRLLLFADALVRGLPHFGKRRIIRETPRCRVQHLRRRSEIAATEARLSSSGDCVGSASTTSAVARASRETETVTRTER